MVTGWLCTGLDIKQSSFGLKRWSIASCSWARYCKLESASPPLAGNMGTGAVLNFKQVGTSYIDRKDYWQ